MEILTDTRFETCGNCEHARMEHGDGACESILLAHGGEYRCTCKRFVRSEN
jgi:hypothetical protein